jgi:hypothetical protein
VPVPVIDIEVLLGVVEGNTKIVAEAVVADAHTPLVTIAL